MKKYNVNTTHYIEWQCPQCVNMQYTIMHSDPNACFVAMECEDCDFEDNTCYCSTHDIITKEQMMARILGRAGGKAPHKRPKNYFSKIAKLPRKRKSANL